MVFYAIGILFTYFLGLKFLDFQFHYFDMALTAIGITILFQFLMLIATYESPRWLFSKNMDYNGTRTLEILRGKKYHVAKEITGIKRKLKENTQNIKDQFLALKQRAVYHPFILVLLVTFFNQFSGITAALNYASQIFSEAGYSDDKAGLATFTSVGVIKLVAGIMSAFLADCAGRRVLFIISSIGIIIRCVLLGTYFLIFEDNCANSLGSPGCPNGLEYLAISSMVMFLATHSIGWSTIGWITMMELLPNQIRTLGGSLANIFAWFLGLIIILSFQPYSALVTPKFTWWTFAVIMALSVVLVILFIPEAKGHSLEEIQEHFEDGNVFVSSCKCVRCTTKKA